MAAIDMVLLWSVLATVTMGLSAVASFLTMVHLRLRWDVRISSVRWLFWLFFLYIWLWCLFRSIYLIWLCALPQQDEQKENPLEIWSDKATHVDRLGIYATMYLREANSTWITIVYCAGDVALLGLALTIFPLTYELWRIARMSMDRGATKERVQIKRYALVVHVLLVAYAVVLLVICVVYKGYNRYALRCHLGLFVLQFLGLAFMMLQVLRLKLNGRQYETRQGAFVASPIYERLKRIMAVYALFAFQYQVSSIVLYFDDPQNQRGMVGYIGISQAIYNSSGLALAVTTSFSQSCIFHVISCCLPGGFEAQFVHRRFAGLVVRAPTSEESEAPRTDPVFVVTDVESSSELWAIEEGQLMNDATNIHDNILRSTLPLHHGYEIATCGDSFQLAFHSVRDAVKYCMDVQLQLLVAKWPRELHGAVAATRRRRSGRRLIFNGLRVRMGIHDAADCEGALVRDTHAVTGKVMYSGASEVVAQFVGDLGCGGQILVTDRIASWLKHHADDISADFYLDRVGLYNVPQIGIDVEVFQVQPSVLGTRRKHFEAPQKGKVPPLNRPRQPSQNIFQRFLFPHGPSSPPIGSFISMHSPRARDSPA